jgi:chemotaxis signal transduction protein
MASTHATAAPEGVAFQAAPEWVVFGCGGRRFALPLGQVREILMPRPFTRLPGCGPEVCGLIALRGRVITVFDFGAALGLGPAVRKSDHRLLLLEHGERLVGGAVETVHAVARAAVAEEDLERGAWRVLPPGPVEKAPAAGADPICLALDPAELLERLLT